MKHKIACVMLLFAVTLSFFSCEKYNAEEEEISKEDNSTLVVRAKAMNVGAGGEEAKVSYPVNIYVFDSGEKCIAVSSIANEADKLELKLPEGNYEVYAVAGADGDTYELPTKDNASTESVINIREGKEFTDLMTAYSSVNLTQGEENTLTLSLRRKVMMLENVTIAGVPEEVNNVAITISPIYSNIRLDGEYEGTDGWATLNLTKQADGTTWKSTGSKYLLEASGPATIKVSLTTASGTVSYSYVSEEELNANYRINISGTYTGGDLTLKGIITGATWYGVKNIDFSFNTDLTPGENPGGEATGSAPAAGSEYKGCYVLSSTKTANGTTVVLVADWKKTNLVFAEGDQASIRAAVDKALKEVAVEGVDATWRLPSAQEKDFIVENLDEINSKLDEYKIMSFKTSGASYYYINEAGEISAFFPGSGKDNELKSDKASLILRPFATILFTE